MAYEDPKEAKTPLVQMAERFDRVEQLKAENAALRQMVSECAAAVGNGTCCAPRASIDFMRSIPGEIRAELAAQRRRDRGID